MVSEGVFACSFLVIRIPFNHHHHYKTHLLYRFHGIGVGLVLINPVELYFEMFVRALEENWDVFQLIHPSSHIVHHFPISTYHHHHHHYHHPC